MAELSLEMQQFLYRIKEAKPMLDAANVTAQQLLDIRHIMKCVSWRFESWFMRGAEGHVVVSLHATGSEPDDFSLRDEVEEHLSRTINPTRLIFSVLLHYRD